MRQPMIQIEYLNLTNAFAYTDPTSKMSTDDMWIDDLLGFLGCRSGPCGPLASRSRSQTPLASTAVAGFGSTSRRGPRSRTCKPCCPRHGRTIKR
jgi:hypothetical protein